MVKNGRAITGSHAVPLGYMVAGEEKNKHVVKNPETEHIAIDMLQHIQKSGSIRKTLLYINEKYDLKICYDSMRHYLMNEKYYGCYRGIENYCEPYISKKEFEAIQSLVRKNVKQNKKHDYIFSGLLRCPVCNHKLAGFTHTTTKPKYNKKYSHPGYRCNSAHNDKLCSYHKYPAEHLVEKYLLDNIESEVKKHILEVINVNCHEEKKKEIDTEKVKAKLGRLTDLYLDGMILREKYDYEFEKLTSMLKQAKNEEPQKTRDLTPYKEFLNSDALFIYNHLNNVSKRMFWANFIDYIVYNEDKTYDIHFK